MAAGGIVSRDIIPISNSARLTTPGHGPTVNNPKVSIGTVNSPSAFPPSHQLGFIGDWMTTNNLSATRLSLTIANGGTGKPRAPDLLRNLESLHESGCKIP